MQRIKYLIWLYSQQYERMIFFSIFLFVHTLLWGFQWKQNQSNWKKKYELKTFIFLLSFFFQINAQIQKRKSVLCVCKFKYIIKSIMKCIFQWINYYYFFLFFLINFINSYFIHDKIVFKFILQWWTFDLEIPCQILA